MLVFVRRNPVVLQLNSKKIHTRPRARRISWSKNRGMRNHDLRNVQTPQPLGFGFPILNLTMVFNALIGPRYYWCVNKVKLQCPEIGTSRPSIINSNVVTWPRGLVFTPPKSMVRVPLEPWNYFFLLFIWLRFYLSCSWNLERNDV